jgi:nucleotide-binding universal stress UspA family protein
MKPVRHILHPTDFSDYGNVALEGVRTYAGLHGAEVHILHVLEPVVSTTDFTWAGFSFAELDTRRQDAAREALQQISAQLESDGIVVHAVVRRGKAHDVIREYAEQNAIDLVILATHGHTGLTHLLLGSTAEMVVRTSPCPVLTIKSKSDASAS